MDPSTLHRRQSVSFCRKRTIGNARAHAPAFLRLTMRSRCSGGLCTAKVRRHAHRVCVARYYDPVTGQFLSLDPDVAETDAPFNYAGDNPVNEDDPLGLGCGLTTPWDCIHGVVRVAKHGTQYLIDAVTDPNYLLYWGSLDLNGLNHWVLSSLFGAVGCQIADLQGAPLVILQAEGLGVDVEGDWLKEHVLGIPGYTVGDEGIPNAFLLGSQAGPIAHSVFGINWRHDFPGVHSNGYIDWWWQSLDSVRHLLSASAHAG